MVESLDSMSSGANMSYSYLKILGSTEAARFQCCFLGKRGVFMSYMKICMCIPFWQLIIGS